MFSVKTYYQNPVIQRRIAEYCGGQEIDPESFSCEYLVGVKEGISADGYFLSVQKDKFFWLLDIEADIFRSVWDRESTLFVLDFEYYNIKYPAEAYFNPQEVYFKLEEIYQRIKNIYEKYNLNYLVIQTGQGYHFVFRIPFNSKMHDQLISLGHLEPTLQGKYNSTTGRRTRRVPLQAGLGFHTAGRILEFVTHILFKNLKDYHGSPIVYSDVSVGKNYEAISLDLTMYADPIYLRDIRCPFSVYQKHKIYHKFKFSTQQIPWFIVLLRRYNKQEFFDFKELVDMRTNISKVLEFAKEVSCIIPEAGNGFLKLLKDYKNSKLYKLHKEFDKVEHDDPKDWWKTYDRFDLNTLPPCVNHCLYFPNDHLLKPTNLQTLTRVLLKLGWHPKHIAGLIRSKYERNYGWGDTWYKYDAASRANFYVRIYSDLVLSGIDKEEDLNCFSHYEKGYCFKPNCGFKLEDYRI